MALHWPTFFTRLGSAIVFCIVMMAGLLWTNIAFAVLALLIQFLCLRDFLRLMPKIFPDQEYPDWLPVVTHTVSIVSFVVVLLYSPSSSSNFTVVIAAIPLCLLLPAALSKNTALMAVMQAFLGLLYIVLPMILFMHMRMQSIVIPLSLVLMIWMNDTMAYLVGSFIGKTPFSPISPKKTWEGTAGGAILTVAGAAIWGYYSHYYHMTDWIALALCAAIAGTAGDLLESKLKRIAGVKDSGTMMPGHGGALDRFDSLLVAIPFAFVYAYLYMPELELSIF